jgi:hypothetical protein
VDRLKCCSSKGPIVVSVPCDGARSFVPRPGASSGESPVALTRVRAICSADPVNVRGDGCDESALTRLTHRRTLAHP